MKSAIWNLSDFNISMVSKYGDLYELESDINNLYGSSNFSELDTLDWFMIDKKKDNISFLLLSIPSIIKDEYEFNSITIDKLRKISLNNSIEKFAFNVNMQDVAYFSMKKNELLVISNLLNIKYKVQVLDNLYFLLNNDYSYQGFLLENATQCIPNVNEIRGDNIFNPLLSKMLKLCTAESYDKMDNVDEYELLNIISLEVECLNNLHKDKRIYQILEFIKNLKFTFYDYE